MELQNFYVKEERQVAHRGAPEMGFTQLLEGFCEEPGSALRSDTADVVDAALRQLCIASICGRTVD